MKIVFTSIFVTALTMMMAAVAMSVENPSNSSKLVVADIKPWTSKT